MRRGEGRGGGRGGRVGVGMWGGWGPGYDVDDGPRLADANAAKRTDGVTPDPTAATFTPADTEPPDGSARVVDAAAQALALIALRAVIPVPPDGGYWGTYPILPMHGIDEEAPVTPEEWMRRPVLPPHPVALRRGWGTPPRGTLSWSHPARVAAMSELRRLQFPQDCDAAKILAVPLEMCPLGCRLHIFLQRALVLSVALGRTLVPLPPWDVGFGHLFQPITNCSLRPGRPGAHPDLASALEELSDLFLASGAPHEKLHPLELTHRQIMQQWPEQQAAGIKLEESEQAERDKVLRGRPLRAMDTVAGVWFDKMKTMLTEHSATDYLQKGGGWEEKKRKLKAAVATLAAVLSPVDDGG